MLDDEQTPSYCGKAISSYSLWELGLIKKSMLETENEREKASKHKKFNKMEFPPPNPEFVKLKLAIETEIRNKQNA